ncbi:MAG: 3',5'-cyclic-AMP phosphodiesterase [Gammaproteobacteria bacterium]|nr:MAG: 3',5'-cyclic-AMP phosphodiesterase [Gammaproteobacteria bacterium]
MARQVAQARHRTGPANFGKARERGLHSAALPPDCLKVLQVTDTHLYADETGRLLGVNTLDSFRSIITTFRETGWRPDLVLATGDLVHDASPEGYRRLAHLLDEFGIPVHCLPGNHDIPVVMREHLRSQRVSCPQVVDCKGWRLILLDSVVPGEVGGHLDAAEIDMLQQALAESDSPTLISLHHQPVPVGSDWIDEMGLDNAEALFDSIAGLPQVKGLLWGHVHQLFDEHRNGVRLMGTPSTCVQFAPGSARFSVDQQQPGFRLLALMPDGQILSEVLRAEGMPQGLDVASGGYE